jgi:hypothetical protein
MSDKSVVEYEPIDPEDLSSMLLDKNEGTNSIPNITQWLLL